MLCENLGKVNLPTLDTGGGFSPYMIMHKSQPHKVSDAIDDEEATLIEPTACAIHAVLKMKFPFLDLEQNCSFLDRY
jgi:D-arabinitol dehydrogenase (NADP+)